MFLKRDFINKLYKELLKSFHGSADTRFGRENVKRDFHFE